MCGIQTSKSQQYTRQLQLSAGHLPRRVTLGRVPDVTSQAFARLHDKYHDRLLNAMTVAVRNRDLAEDITSTVFLSAFRNSGTFRGESSFYTWLYAIAFNESVRAQRHNRGISLDSFGEFTPRELIEPDHLEQAQDRSDCCARLRVALYRLPKKYRSLLVEHFVRGHSVKHISARQHVPIGTILSRIHKAKTLLRRAWARDAHRERTGLFGAAT